MVLGLPFPNYFRYHLNSGNRFEATKQNSFSFLLKKDSKISKNKGMVDPSVKIFYTFVT